MWVLIIPILRYYSTPDLPGKVLTLDDLGLLLEELLGVRTNWYYLGLLLKLSTGTLDGIKRDFPNPRDQLLEILKTWLRTSYNRSYNHRWKTLLDALRSRSVGASQLADHLEAKYCRLKDVHESKH